jgi:hypothetical protein
MGLSDVLNGMRNGPRGEASTSTSGSSGGMSPITMGLLAFLAYKALKGSGVLGSSTTEQPQAPLGSNPPNSIQSERDGSDWLSCLEKMIAGGGAGSILSDRILAELKEHLPCTVDTLTPEGRIPSEQEARRWA